MVVIKELSHRLSASMYCVATVVLGVSLVCCKSRQENSSKTLDAGAKSGERSDGQPKYPWKGFKGGIYTYQDGYLIGPSYQNRRTRVFELPEISPEMEKFDVIYWATDFPEKITLKCSRYTPPPNSQQTDNGKDLECEGPDHFYAGLYLNDYNNDFSVVLLGGEGARLQQSRPPLLPEANAARVFPKPGPYIFNSHGSEVRAIAVGTPVPEGRKFAIQFFRERSSGEREQMEGGPRQDKFLMQCICRPKAQCVCSPTEPPPDYRWFSTMRGKFLECDSDSCTLDSALYTFVDVEKWKNDAPDQHDPVSGNRLIDHTEEVSFVAGMMTVEDLDKETAKLNSSN